MKIIYRHLLKEYIPPLFYCVLGFSLIFLLCDLFGRFARTLKAGLSPHVFVLFFTARMLPSLEYLLPAALLFSTLYTLWQLGRNNEVTAMRAGGVSVYLIAMPFLIIGLVMSLFSVVIKEAVVPAAMQWEHDLRYNNMKPVEQKIVHDQPFYNARENRRWWIQKMDLKDPSSLHNVELVKESPKTLNVEQRITAEKAEYMDGAWWFFDGKIEQYTTAGGLREMTRIPPYPFGLEMVELTEQPDAFVNDRKSPEYMSSLQLIKHLERHPYLSEKEKARRKTSLHTRLALPWACFIVILFGIPAGMRNSRQNALTGIMIAVCLFLAFWGFMQAGGLMGMSGLIPPWLAAWASNIVFLGAGVVMMLKMR